MHDVSEYLKNFFMGPYADQEAAVLGASGRHGERSMVVAHNDGSWWAKVWPEENYHPELWPTSFQFVDRWTVGTIIVRNTPVRVSRSRAVSADIDGFDFGFDFSDWAVDEGFEGRLHAANEDFKIENPMSPYDDELFFAQLSQRDPAG